MTHSYVIWIPFEFPPRRDIIFNEPVGVDVCGYPGKFRRHLRFKGLEIDELPSEDTAKKVFKRATAALLYATIGRGPHMRFDLDLVPVTYKEGDPIVYWEQPSLIGPTEPQPFNASRAVIFRGDKQIIRETLYAELSTSGGIERFVDVFRKALALPTLQDGVMDEKLSLAAELYCLAGFEASDRAQFLTLFTVLEVLTPLPPVMDDIAHQVDRWVEEARHQTETARERQEERQERAWEAFADRLGDLKRVSITSGLKSRVEQLLRLDGQTDAASQAARVARLYGKQSRVAHRGRPVSNDELFELDEIVRRTLIAAMRREEASSPG